MKKFTKEQLSEMQKEGKKIHFNEDQTVDYIENKDGTYDLFLPSGKRALMIKGKTKHAINASRKIDGDSSLYISGMISELVTIEGNPVFLESIGDDLPLKDYNYLMVKMSEANFI